MMVMMELLPGSTTATGNRDVAPGSVTPVFIPPTAAAVAATEARIVGEFLQHVAVPEAVVVVVWWGGRVAVPDAAAEDSGQVLF